MVNQALPAVSRTPHINRCLGYDRFGRPVGKGIDRNGRWQSISFWQQDQNYWSQQQSESQATSAQDSLINVMASAESNLSKGLVEHRQRNGLDTRQFPAFGRGAERSAIFGRYGVAIVERRDQGRPRHPPVRAPSGVRKFIRYIRLSYVRRRPEQARRISHHEHLAARRSASPRAARSPSVGAGAGMTTYASTGSDTVGDLMSAINADFVGNAAVTASLNRNGELVITSKNDTDTVTVGGVSTRRTYWLRCRAMTPSSRPKPLLTLRILRSSPRKLVEYREHELERDRRRAPRPAPPRAPSTVPTIALGEHAGSAAAILSASGASGNLVDMLA
jgi:hypothetical protein